MILSAVTSFYLITAKCGDGGWLSVPSLMGNEVDLLLESFEISSGQYQSFIPLTTDADEGELDSLIRTRLSFWRGLGYHKGYLSLKIPMEVRMRTFYYLSDQHTPPALILIFSLLNQ